MKALWLTFCREVSLLLNAGELAWGIQSGASSRAIGGLFLPARRPFSCAGKGKGVSTKAASYEA